MSVFKDDQVTYTGNVSILGSLTISGTLTVTGNLNINGSVVINGQVLPRSHIGGLTLSTAGGSSTFSVAVGQTADSTNLNIMTLQSAISKTTSAWAVGTGNGALDTSTIANSTWYHVYLIERTDSGVVDVLISLNATSPTMPASYTLFRRIGSMKTDGSAHWVKFSQLGDEFLWDTAVQDAANITLGTTATLVTLSTPPGVQALANVSMFSNSGAAVFFIASSPDVSDILPAITAFDNISLTTSQYIYEGLVRTNTSSQIRWRASVNGTVSSYVYTKGWVDYRGRQS